MTIFTILTVDGGKKKSKRGCERGSYVQKQQITFSTVNWVAARLKEHQLRLCARHIVLPIPVLLLPQTDIRAPRCCAVLLTP